MSGATTRRTDRCAMVTMWCSRLDSNQRTRRRVTSGYEPGALTTTRQEHMAEEVGFEPTHDFRRDGLAIRSITTLALLHEHDALAWLHRPVISGTPACHRPKRREVL